MLNNLPPHSESNFESYEDKNKPSKKKNYNVDSNSILAYQEECRRGKIETLKGKIERLLADNKPLTSRQIARTLNVERGCITAPLKLLEDAGKISVAFKAKCPETAYTVNHYKATGQND